MTGVSERANGRASVPVLQSVFLAVLDHSVLGSLVFLDATAHLYKRSCPSVGLSVRPSVLSYFQMTNMAVLKIRSHQKT